MNEKIELTRQSFLAALSEMAETKKVLIDTWVCCCSYGLAHEYQVEREFINAMMQLTTPEETLDTMRVKFEEIEKNLIECREIFTKAERYDRANEYMVKEIECRYMIQMLSNDDVWTNVCQLYGDKIREALT